MTVQKPSDLPDNIDLDTLPVAETEPYTDADERLVQRFTEIEKESIDRLTDGGKRLVEWGTAAIGIFFASLALLENPTVLAAFQGWLPKTLGITAVTAYLLAMLLGFLVSMPMRYRYNPNDLTLMEQQLRRVFDRKYVMMVAGTALFVLGALALSGVIVTVLLAI